MQKKLLLFFIAVNCVAVQANEVNVDNGDTVEQNAYADYSKSLEPRYNQALVDEVATDNYQINNLYSLINQEHATEESNRRNKQCNGCHITGDPSPGTDTGDKFKHFADEHKGKNGANKDLHDIYANHKKEIRKKIIHTTKQALEHRNYVLGGTIYKALVECGKNEDCLLRAGAPCFVALSSPDYVDNFYAETYDSAVELVEKEGIPLTKEQIIVIAQTNPETKSAAEQFFATAKNVKDKIQEILNPQKPANPQGDLLQK